MDEVKAREEIAFIRRIMEESKRVTRDNGKYYIAWGIIVALGLFATYFAVIFKWRFIGWLWIILVGVGWLYSFIMGYRDRLKERAETFAGKVLAFTWIGCGIAMTILGFVGSWAGGIKLSALSAVMAAVMGIGYFVSSVVYPHGWLKYFAFGWWLGGIVMFIWPGPHTVLMLGFMVVLFQIVPGLILFMKYRKELAEE